MVFFLTFIYIFIYIFFFMNPALGSCILEVIASREIRMMR